MKIGIILPIGDLNKFGYQYISDLIISNLEEFGDHIFAISTSRNNRKDFFSAFKKTSFVSNEETWFELVDGCEVFSFEKLIENINLGLSICKERNFDAAVQIHINQYIPESSRIDLKKSIEKMIEEEKKFEWLYKKYQCGQMIFNADTRVPWILNLNVKNPYVYEADAISSRETNETIPIENGNHRKFNKQAITDVFGEFNSEDAKNVHDFTRLGKNKLHEKTYSSFRFPPFDEESWFKYYQYKFNEKVISKETMDKFGMQILSRRKNNFVSVALEKNYSPHRKSTFSGLVTIVKNKIWK
jgi:hypothetical protein